MTGGLGRGYGKRMSARLARQDGFSIIEAMVSMFVISLAGVAVLATMATGAKVNERAADRKAALALADRQLDRLRSLDYTDAGMLSLAQDARQGDSDWLTDYCPVQGGCAPGGRLVTLSPSPTFASLAPSDPRQAKIVQKNPPASSSSSFFANGIVLYTYVYWDSAVAASRHYKLATVVARFRDPPSGVTGTAKANYGTVRLTAVLVDDPGIGQIPSS